MFSNLVAYFSHTFNFTAMLNATEVSPKIYPSYEAFLAYYDKIQDLENFCTLSDIQNSILYLLTTLLAETRYLDEEKLRKISDKISFLECFKDELHQLKLIPKKTTNVLSA
jgi:hypothetical protein